MGKGHVLVLGGARSGKTGFAERLAIHADGRPVYLATATALDDEMRERVRTHRQLRAGRFRTVEEPLELTAALVDTAKTGNVVLVDCLTLWISNLLAANRDVAAAVDELNDALGALDTTRVILVSNEVGFGIVPDNALARSFRDLTGAAHQRLAETCAHVYFVVAGLPMVLKGDPPMLGAPPSSEVHEA